MAKPWASGAGTWTSTQVMTQAAIPAPLANRGCARRGASGSNDSEARFCMVTPILCPTRTLLYAIPITRMTAVPSTSESHKSLANVAPCQAAPCTSQRRQHTRHPCSPSSSAAVTGRAERPAAIDRGGSCARRVPAPPTGRTHTRGNHRPGTAGPHPRSESGKGRLGPGGRWAASTAGERGARYPVRTPAARVRERHARAARRGGAEPIAARQRGSC